MLWASFPEGIYGNMIHETAAALTTAVSLMATDKAHSLLPLLTIKVSFALG